MALDTSELEVMAAAGAADIDHISLHTALPDGTGSNLSTAGKQAVTLTSASGVITIPETAFTGGDSSGAVAAVGFWASAGTVWRGYFVPTGDLAFNAAGDYTVNQSTITGSSS